MKRILDILVSLILLLVLAPVLLIVFLIVKLSSAGPGIYKQVRVGKGRKNFTIFKFRTMTTSQKKDASLLTIGENDDRITRVGYWLRKYKLDELPQLWNVFTGKMSLVGPRPEVRKYVELYTDEQLKIFNVKPGVTDYASIQYAEESKLLRNIDDPEDYYIKVIMPNKLQLNLYYIKNRTLWMDLSILSATFFRILRIQ